MNKPQPLTRRKFAKMLGTVVFLSPATISTSQAASSELSLDELLSQPIIAEPQFGDPLEPNDKYETLTLVHPSQQKAVGDDPILPKKDAEQLALQMLKITRQFVKDEISRNHQASQVIEFLRVVDFQDLDTPFCAAGVSYAACRAYCDLHVSESYDAAITNQRVNKFKSKMTTIYAHYFFPSASVRVIKAAAIKKGNWVDRTVTPKPGWPIIFSWDGTSAGNHIGLVEAVDAQNNSIKTLEYNTTVTINGNQRDGGHVARKSRPLDHHVLGYVKIYG
jgi:hypothetical protein